MKGFVPGPRRVALLFGTRYMEGVAEVPSLEGTQQLAPQ